jgi:hypothetical protein
MTPLSHGQKILWLHYASQRRTKKSRRVTLKSHSDTATGQEELEQCTKDNGEVKPLLVVCHSAQDASANSFPDPVSAQLQ